MATTPMCPPPALRCRDHGSNVAPQVSAVQSATSVLLGKANVARRDRVLATTAGGREVWASANLYAVLFREAGPGPTK